MSVADKVQAVSDVKLIGDAKLYNKKLVGDVKTLLVVDTGEC